MKRKKLLTKTVLIVAMLFVGMNASWAVSYTNGSVVAAGGEYFLYNIGAGKFLDNGSDYNTRAVVDNSGQELTLAVVDSENGIYTVYTGLGNGYFTGAWMDASSTELTFEELATNPTGYTGKVYKIKNGDNYSVYSTDASMWHADAYKSSAKGSCVDLIALSGTNNDYWLLIPKSERQAAGDYTHLIKEASFNWTSSSVWNNTNSSATLGGLITNLCYEAYNKTFDVYQYNTGLANGVYRVKVTGFYRNGTNYNTDDNVNSYLYATGYNQVTANLPLIITGGNASILYENTTEGSTWMTDTKQGDVYVPNSQNGASAYIANGNYGQTTVDVYVDDGELTIGVKCDYNVASSWTVFDEFELEYIGNSLMQDAVAFTNGATMTVGTWYYLDAGATEYTIAAGSDLTNIIYTTDGAMLTEAANELTANFSGTQTLTATRYYFKAKTTAQTLTFTPRDYEDKTEEVYNFESNIPTSSTGCSFTDDSEQYVTVDGSSVYLLENSCIDMKGRFAGGITSNNGVKSFPWYIVKNSGGLKNQSANANKGFAILNLSAGDYVTITYVRDEDRQGMLFSGSNNISGLPNNTLFVSGNTYRMNTSGGLYLSVGRNLRIESIKIATSTPVLNAPKIVFNSMVESDGIYNPKYSFSSTDDGVSYYDGDGNDISSGYTFTAAGTLTYYAGKTGRTNSAKQTYTVTSNQVGMNLTNSIDVKDLYGTYADNGNKEFPVDLDYTLIPNVTFSPVDNSNGCTYRTAHNSTIYNALYGRNRAFTATCSNLSENEYVVFADYTGKAYAPCTSASNITSVATSSTLKYYNLYTQPTLTQSITVSDAEWKTLVSQYSLDFTSVEGLKAYIVTGGTDGVLKKTRVKKVPAGTALLLNGIATTHSVPVISKTAATDDVSGNKLVGVVTNKEIAAETGFVLMVSPSLAFYKNANTFTLGANTAYLPVGFDANNQEARLSFLLDDMETTGVESVQELKGSKVQGYYDLQGRRVSQPTKGMYIMDGKKVVIK